MSVVGLSLDKAIFPIISNAPEFLENLYYLLFVLSGCISLDKNAVGSWEPVASIGV